MKQVLMTHAKQGSVRAYLQAKCVRDGVVKMKLLVEITQKQSPKYKDFIGRLLQQAQHKAKDGTTFFALKSWATTQRAELLK